MFQNDTLVISDFKKEIGVTNWYVVDDGVMGGLSQGDLNLNKARNLLYTGTVKTENNGGFSSIRHNFEVLDVSNYKTIKVVLKGDGKSYQFRIKDNRSQGFSYIKIFETTGEWETVEIPLDQFYPSYRGYTLDKPNYSGAVMEEIAILIGNKKNESFELEIEKIYVE